MFSMRWYIGKAVALALLLATTTISSLGFDVDGYRSGMSIADVAKMTSSRHREFWQTDGDDIGGKWAVGGPVGPGCPGCRDIDATLYFCRNKLAVYSHNIDFDADFWLLLNMLIDRHGQPSKVEARSQTWPGPGG